MIATDTMTVEQLERRRVVCAANKHRVSGAILCGARHWDDHMRSIMTAAGWKDYGNWGQGFIDQFGNWMSREEALILAREKNQIPPHETDCVHGNILISENIY